MKSLCKDLTSAGVALKSLAKNVCKLDDCVTVGTGF